MTKGSHIALPSDSRIASNWGEVDSSSSLMVCSPNALASSSFFNRTTAASSSIHSVSIFSRDLWLKPKENDLLINDRFCLTFHILRKSEFPERAQTIKLCRLLARRLLLTSSQNSRTHGQGKWTSQKKNQIWATDPQIPNATNCSVSFAFNIFYGENLQIGKTDLFEKIFFLGSLELNFCWRLWA